LRNADFYALGTNLIWISRTTPWPLNRLNLLRGRNGKVKLFYFKADDIALFLTELHSNEIDFLALTNELLVVFLFFELFNALPKAPIPPP